MERWAQHVTGNNSQVIQFETPKKQA